jgi:uncharacterized protein YfaQ (DUF2300 family)
VANKWQRFLNHAQMPSRSPSPEVAAVQQATQTIKRTGELIARCGEIYLFEKFVKILIFNK